MGLQSKFVPKKPTSQSDGLCVAWNPNRFQLLDSFVLSFSEVMSHIPGATPNIALFMAFEDSMTGHRIVLATSHFYWHWDYDHLRAIQAQHLFSELVQWMNRVELTDAEMIVCGDFNSDPKSIAYELITRHPTRDDHFFFVMRNSGLTQEQLAELRGWFQSGVCPPIRSAYSTQAIRLEKDFGAYGELPWTTYTQASDTLDYIFFREDSLLVVKQLLMLPAMQIVLEETALPNRYYVSDHIALVAEFAYGSRNRARSLSNT